MKNSNSIIALLFLLITMTLTSCEAIVGIFKAGMGFGIFIVVAIIVAVLFLISRIGRSKKV